MSQNRMFLSPPGTGKTTVAKLYGEILGELGLLSSKDVIFMAPSDFIGQYIGDTEANTRSIVDSTIGKALVIDEAHTLFSATDNDRYRQACINTLVSRIHNRPGENRGIILIGYTDQMEEMSQKGNPCLRRRLPLEEALSFHGYDDEQISEIFHIKMAKEYITTSKQALDVAAKVLRRARDRPNFGNEGNADNLLNQAKARFRDRRNADKAKHTLAEQESILNRPDVDKEGAHTDGEGGEHDLSEDEDQIAIILEP